MITPTPSAIGTQQIPRLVFGSTTIDLERGETFKSGFVESGNQSVLHSKGGSPAIATWNVSTGLLSYSAFFEFISEETLNKLVDFFGLSGVNFMESNFTYMPNANEPSLSYDMRLASASGFTFKEVKSGGIRRLFHIAIKMRREV